MCNLGTRTTNAECHSLNTDKYVETSGKIGGGKDFLLLLGLACRFDDSLARNSVVTV